MLRFNVWAFYWNIVPISLPILRDVCKVGVFVSLSEKSERLEFNEKNANEKNVTGRSGSRSYLLWIPIGCFLKWKSTSSFDDRDLLVEKWKIIFCVVNQFWPFLSFWSSPFLSAHLPNGCRMPSSTSSSVLGISVEVEMWSSWVFGFSVVTGFGGGGVSLCCSCLIASISPVSIALYSSSVNVKNSETDLSWMYANALYSFWMVVIFAGGVWLINLFSGTDSRELQPEVILTRQ